MELPAEVRTELEQAGKASEDGNDGRARVCARRAVGKAFILSAYGRRQGNESMSSIQCLNVISELKEISDGSRQASRRLVRSVAEKGEESVSRNPVKDAMLIIVELLAG